MINLLKMGQVTLKSFGQYSMLGIMNEMCFGEFSMGSCLVIFQSVVLDILSVHFRCRILRRHLSMKVCILLSVLCVLRHVSNT